MAPDVGAAASAECGGDRRRRRRAGVGGVEKSRMVKER